MPISIALSNRTDDFFTSHDFVMKKELIFLNYEL